MTTQLPSLPSNPLSWSSNVLNATHILKNLYENALRVTTSHNANHSRLTWHLNTIYTDALPLLLELSFAAVQENIPENWLLECGECFSNLINHIKSAIDETGDNENV